MWRSNGSLLWAGEALFILWEKSRGNEALLSLFFAELYTSLPQHVPILHIQGNIQGRYFNPGGPMAAVFWWQSTPHESPHNYGNPKCWVLRPSLRCTTWVKTQLSLCDHLAVCSQVISTGNRDAFSHSFLQHCLGSALCKASHLETPQFKASPGPSSSLGNENMKNTED